CALHPSAVETAKELLPKAKAALSRAGSNSRGQLVNTIGAVYYRGGQLDEALKLFDESVKSQGKGGYVEDWLFLAMVHQRQGRPEKAKEYFDRLTEEMKKLRGDKPLADGRTADWRLRVELELLYA